MNYNKVFIVILIGVTTLLNANTFKDSNNNGKWDPGEDLINIYKNDKLVTIGGSVTEVVFQLGLGGLVIAVDQSSTFPARVKDLPQVGYHRYISSEGVLSMMPTKIIATTDMGPAVAVEQIKNSGVNVQIYNSPNSIDDIIKLIDKIAMLFNVEEQADIVKARISSIKDVIDRKASNYKSKPKMAFFMNPATGSYSAAGAGTNANYLIDFLGGVNVFSKDFDRYQKVNKEQILKYNPDIILVASYSPAEKASLHFMDGDEFKSLKCVKEKNVIDITMSDLTMGPSFAPNALSIIKKVSIDKK